MARVLIGNDDPQLLELFAELLRAAGHIVRVVADGHRAVEIARHWRPDLVVVDLVMPKLDGASAIQALRADAATADIPILMISGSERGEALAVEAGADSFLAKPFGSAELVGRVNELLAR